MLVDRRPLQAGGVEARAAVEHRLGEGDGFGVIESPQVRGHQERRHLVVWDMPSDVSERECPPLAGLDPAAVPLPFDQAKCEHCRAVGVSLLSRDRALTAPTTLCVSLKQGFSDMKLDIAVVSGLVLIGAAAGAQNPPRTMSAAEHVKLGDQEHATMNAPIALRHYEAALKVDSMDYDALVKAAREAVDVGLFNPNEEERAALYKRAEVYARRAVAVKPNEAESHFELARAIGRSAQTMGTRDKVKYAGVVHDEATAALKLDPNHSGALHVLAEWNAEIMRLNGISRFMAKNLLGGKTFGEASWDNAQRLMEQVLRH